MTWSLQRQRGISINYFRKEFSFIHPLYSLRIFNPRKATLQLSLQCLSYQMKSGERLRRPRRGPPRRDPARRPRPPASATSVTPSGGARCARCVSPAVPLGSRGPVLSLPGTLSPPGGSVCSLLLTQGTVACPMCAAPPPRPRLSPPASPHGGTRRRLPPAPEPAA